MPSLPPTFSSRRKAGSEWPTLLKRISTRLQKIKTRPPRDLDEAVHEIRTLTKFLRALLWLAKPAFAPAVSSAAKTQLKDAANELSAPRDLAVMQSALEDLEKKTSPAKSRGKALEKTRQAFAARKNPAKQKSSLRQALGEAIRGLQHAIEHLRQTEPDKLPAHLIDRRLDKAIHLVHRARHRAFKKEKPADFHQWRKKAKRLLYLLQSLEPDPGKKMARTLKHLDRLQHHLGDYHDTDVLQERLEKDPPIELGRTKRQALFHLLKKQKKRLRQKAEKTTIHFARK